MFLLPFFSKSGLNKKSEKVTELFFYGDCQELSTQKNSAKSQGQLCFYDHFSLKTGKNPGLLPLATKQTKIPYPKPLKYSNKA